jgi:peptide-methionine (S)-S-oxide reductase
MIRHNREANATEFFRRPTMHLKKSLTLFVLLLFSLVGVGCSQPGASLADPINAPSPIANVQEEGLAEATFAGGCFWCMEKPFDKLDGVVSTTSGYTGGQRENPTYEQVSSGSTGHTESVQIRYDPKKVSYEELLSVFWHNVDPLDPKGQFCDKGSQYRSGIFYGNDGEKALAEASKAELEATDKFKPGIVTEITAAGAFYPAEDYHQDYYQKSPVRYNFYRNACGRDRRLEKLWGDQAGH